MAFCELHTRSAFSFLSSGTLPEDLAVRAAELDIGTVALLDRDTVAGAVRFHLEAKAKGVKAIIGAEITLEDKGVLPLIPVNVNGYRNLCKLITDVKLRHKKGEHFATLVDVEKYSKDLLCITGDNDGFVRRSIAQHKGQESIGRVQDIFKDRLYIELQRHYSRREEDLNQSLLGLAAKFRIPYFASNGPYYSNQQDRELLDVFTCIKNHCTLDEAGRLLAQNDERYLKSSKQMYELFREYPGAVERTQEIADQVKFSMNKLGYDFPAYHENGKEMDQFSMNKLLREQSEKGALKLYGSFEGRVREQLETELNLIEKLKLAGYFLMVWDITQFCKNNNIMAQGRGSAANSVVCFALGITAVDPIKAELLFARFLSEERGEFPDIDIDLPSKDDREEAIQYVYRKYGERGAAMTANVISYRGRSAIREVGKVFGFGENELGILAKNVSRYGTGSAEEMENRFNEVGFDADADFRVVKFKELYDRILDFPRHLGQHSGGMVVSWKALDGVVPLEPASMPNRNIIQWDKDDCERMGIVKVDLLGLGMMAVLRDTITLVREHHGENIEMGVIPHDDPEVYKTLQNGDTVGTFQVESRAQINFLPRAHPEEFYDLVVQVAIIRPGPIVGKMLSAYLHRRQEMRRLGAENVQIDYMHPKLEPVLKRTLGVPLFQEQLLRMVAIMANFTGGEAEELRRALGFKRADKRLKKIEARMRDGMAANNIDAETQEKIVHSVTSFANYGFPESHAASFALLTYASIYYKVHYLAAFTAAMLNNYPLGFYSPATLIKDAQRHGLNFRPIDVNRSEYICTIELDNNIRVLRLGLKYVKGLRKDAGELIAAERRQNGPYTGVEDLVKRTGLNRRYVRSLSLAGALNFAGTVNRRQALWESEAAVKPKGELFELSVEEPESNEFIKPMNRVQLMEADYHTSGLTIGSHPMSFIRAELTRRGILSSKDTFYLKKRDVVMVAGAVIVRQRPSTARNVVFITLEDETGHSNFIVMPDTYERFRTIIVQSDFLLIKGISEGNRMIKALYFEPIRSLAADVVRHDFH